jgi:hypothetical protein
MTTGVFAKSESTKISNILSVRETLKKKITRSDTIYSKYLCNGKTNQLELHPEQPGYPSDGLCTATMQEWSVCASLDSNLAGTVCTVDVVTPVYTKYLCNGKTNLLETHMDQPGYPTDGVCTTTMDPWHVCASLDTTLS